MTTETKQEEGMLTTMGAVIDLMVETQTILQLLVKHNIVTPEEVQATRSYVSRQKKYADMRSAIAQKLDDNAEMAKFETLFEKSLGPGGRESLTEEERNYLLNKMNSLTRKR